jgi:hypothetical protein
MPRKSLSITKGKQIDGELYKECMTRAVAMYEHESNKTTGQLGLCKVCAQVEKEFFSERGIHIKPNHNTLSNLVKGGRLHIDANGEKSWLTAEEADVVINYTLELAEMGHPLDHRCLKEHVDEICRAQYGPKFPALGVGKQWTY